MFQTLLQNFIENKFEKTTDIVNARIYFLKWNENKNDSVFNQVFPLIKMESKEELKHDIQVSHNIYSYRRDNLIREGDTVIIYEGADNMKQLVMKRGERF